VYDVVVGTDQVPVMLIQVWNAVSVIPNARQEIRQTPPERTVVVYKLSVPWR
jgi:hypothetical protein